MGKKIGILNLKKQYSLIKKEIDTAVRRVFDSSVFIGGKEVEGFEKEFSNFCKVKNVVSVNSGTDALFLCLKALGVKSGDEVITTPFTFIATAEVIANLGAKPVFVDIKSDDFNIDSDLIEKAVTSKTKAIIPVHLFGKPAQMDKIMKIAKKYKLYVIEDACQAVGSKFKGKITGSIGDCGCFSFFPSKNLGGSGDGGMIITKNPKLAEKIRTIKNHGSSAKEKYLNLVIGINSRLDSIQAAILRVKLKYLKAWNLKRMENAKYYNKNLKSIGELVLPEIESGHVFNQYVIKAEKRDELKKYLFKNGIETNIYYPIPLHLQPAFKYLRHKKGDFPISEKMALKVLSLPVSSELLKEEQDYIIRVIRNFYEKN